MRHASATIAPPTPRVDLLSQRDFHRIATLVTKHSGIKLPEAKRVMLEGRIRKRAKAAGYDRLADYCAALGRADGLAAELPHLVDAATTNKTDFYREPQHFDFLLNRIVPEALAKRRGEGRPILKFWSAACSNGAEAYTIAMIVADLERARGDFSWSILGTDISRPILADARQAIYPAEMAAPIPRAALDRYVMHGVCGAALPKIRIVPELRRMVRFATLNLMDKDYGFDRDFDAIFLRNVLIYFERADQEAVVLRLCRHLRPGGYLLLGHAESTIGSALGFTQVAPATFQVG